MAKAKAEKPGKSSLFSFANASVADKTFYVVIGIFLTIFLILVLYPCLFVIAASFSSVGAVSPVRFISGLLVLTSMVIISVLTTPTS